MVRTPLIAAVAAGLMMTGVVAPAVASASTGGSSAAVSMTAPGNVAAGSSLGPLPIAQSLLFLPTVLGVGSNRHFSEALQQQAGGNGEISQQSHS